MRSAFGASILAYWNGNSSAYRIIERDDGHKEKMLVEYLFADKSKWSLAEISALQNIPPRSRILDVGCGAGRVALQLQEDRHEVVGLDSCREAIEVAKGRGLRYTHLADVCNLKAPPVFDEFDAILMMGNNFGICGDIFTTERLLERLSTFLVSNGLLIFSCRDPLMTDNPVHLDYHQKNREKGRPPGLVRIRIAHEELTDDWWDLLFVSKITAIKMLGRTGFEEISSYQDDSPVYYVVAKKKGG
ncbi:MAG: class I SAM-dependent DNA methyltransferase [Candidatus Odinarchaeota archaeon]